MSHSNTPAQRDPIEIQQIPVAALEPDPRNARAHSKQQVRQIGASIQELGFVHGSFPLVRPSAYLTGSYTPQ